nr:DUF1579 family protein [Lysobacter antibioticus]
MFAQPVYIRIYVDGGHPANPDNEDQMMRKFMLSGIALIGLTACSLAGAQVATTESRHGQKKKIEVGQPHRQLDYFVGRWNTKLSHGDAPGDPGTATFTMELGGRYLHQHYIGRMEKRDSRALATTATITVAKSTSI